MQECCQLWRAQAQLAQGWVKAHAGIRSTVVQLVDDEHAREPVCEDGVWLAELWIHQRLDVTHVLLLTLILRRPNAWYCL